jgi:L-aspartate oxidase
MIKGDCLIIGSGIAGLSLALKMAKKSQVILITKRELSDSATERAQGGVACVIDRSDSFESHISDTMVAGAGLCKQEIVSSVVRHAPALIKELVNLGVEFSRNENHNSGFDLGLEAAHSKRRILHAGDMTGKEIEKVLVAKVIENPNIKIYTQQTAVDLIIDDEGICRGAFVLNNKTNEVENFEANAVILATGGGGKTYLYTTNPDIATGDGIAMAYRAGANIKNMEFVQFHPTCFYNQIEKSFLISEAVRGEGGILRLKNGEPFMHKHHPLKELAPRDIVSRAIDTELKKSGDDFVYLDITAQKADFIKKHFPGIYAKCLEYKIDITKDMIPVIPAAHFLCGGVEIDENGQSTIPHLYAIGETACSGVHGANRLASNSLLEGIVYAQKTYEHLQGEGHAGFARSRTSAPLCHSAWSEAEAQNPSKPFSTLPLPLLSSLPCRVGDASSLPSPQIIKNWKSIRHLSWNNLGITRSNKSLQQAFEQITQIQSEIKSYFMTSPLNTDLIELRNIAYIANIITRCALLRKESRGTHYNTDYPKPHPHPQDTTLNISKQLPL